jgi:hypothetical protein
MGPVDPRIVDAASEIINTEAQFADLERFQPRVELLPLPRLVRHKLLPWALRRVQHLNASAVSVIQRSIQPASAGSRRQMCPPAPSCRKTGCWFA